jgi:class 3 adenylate cyclase
MNSTDSSAPNIPGPVPPRRRRLRAVFAADIANYGGLMTIDETNTLDALWITRRVAIEELATHGGWLFGLPGDGIFALFESTVDAVRCALAIQSRLSQCPKLYALKLRIGVHLGEVLFQDELPYGEALVIAARLESLAEPGGILVSASVMEAAAPRIAATFVENGFPTLKHVPRRIETFRVLPPPVNEQRQADALLDRTIAPNRAAPQEPEPRLDPPAAPTVPPLPKAAPLIVHTEIATPPDAAAIPTPIPSMAPSSSPVEAPAKNDAPVDAPAVAPVVAPVAAPAVAAVVAPVVAPAVEPMVAPVDEKPPVAQAASFDEARLGQISSLLAIYFGPVAKMLVRRTAVECADTTQLIRLLAHEIPTERERLDFLTRATDAMAERH